MTREDIAKKIIKMHQNNIPMESGWRDQNDWRVEQFAYTVTDWILNRFIYTEPDPSESFIESSQDRSNNV